MMCAGILQSQLTKGSLSQSDVKASVCGLKEVDSHELFFLA